MALKRILIPIFFVLAVCPTSTKGDDGGYWGTVLEIGAANYVVQLDEGSLLDVEWDSGYDGWSRGDRSYLRLEAVAAICTAKARSKSSPIILQI